MDTFIELFLSLFELFIVANEVSNKVMNIFWIILFFRFFLRNFVSCKEKELQKTCAYIEYAEKELHLSDNGCAGNDICKRKFNISYINLPPYNTVKIEGLKFVQDILTKCCWPCVTYEEINNFPNITMVTAFALNSSDFIFPIVASVTTRKLYGFYYSPYINAPKALYITRKDDEITLLQIILRLGPVIIVCLLLALVSGFIAWIIETWSNKEEFPRSFLIGWFEGVWWSFISMTTVGYGDKTPKSIAARIFSVIWILIGILVFGIITGEITGGIIRVNSPPPADMKDAKVGVLRYRDYDLYVISQQGGIVTQNEDATNFTSDLLQLIRKLEEREIDGFLLDKWTLWYATNILKHHSNFTEDLHLKNTITFFMKNTIRTEKGYEGEKLAYGILVKHMDDYEYFKDFIQDSRLRIEIRSEMYWNRFRNEMKEKDIGTFYSDHRKKLFSSKYFFYYITVLSGMLGTIVVFGIIYELGRKHNTTVCSE